MTSNDVLSYIRVIRDLLVAGETAVALSDLRDLESDIMNDGISEEASR